MDTSQTTMIAGLLVLFLAILGWFFYFGPGPRAVVEVVEEASFGGALFDGVQAPVSEATDAIPETNPLEQVQANPLEGYKNPFSN